MDVHAQAELEPKLALFNIRPKNSSRTKGSTLGLGLPCRFSPCSTLDPRLCFVFPELLCCNCNRSIEEDWKEEERRSSLHVEKGFVISSPNPSPMAIISPSPPIQRRIFHTAPCDFLSIIAVPEDRPSLLR